MGRPRAFDEDQVVAQATEVFWSKGYRRTTPRDLLDATGLSKSSLYATFGNKQGLFLRALERYIDTQEQGLRVSLSGDLRDVLERMYNMIIATATAEEPMSCIVCTASIEADPCETDLVAHITRSRERLEAVFAERFQRAQREGELDADRDPVALARFVLNNNMGLIVQARAGMSAQALHQIAEQVVDAVCA